MTFEPIRTERLLLQLVRRTNADTEIHGDLTFSAR
jgi:hypothetical protein